MVYDKEEVLVSYCCCNELHKFSDLKQHKFSSLTICSIGQKSKIFLSGLKSRCLQGCVLSIGFRR